MRVIILALLAVTRLSLADEKLFEDGKPLGSQYNLSLADIAGVNAKREEQASSSLCIIPFYRKWGWIPQNKNIHLAAFKN